MHNTTNVQAHVIQRIELTESCSIVRISADEKLSQLIQGQVINVSTSPPGSTRRISTFSVLKVYSNNDFSLLVRASGKDGVSDSLTGKDNDIFWVSNSFETKFKYPYYSATPILCLVAGSGISILGGLAPSGILKNADVLFIGRGEDCAIIPPETIQHICDSSDKYNCAPRTLEVWNTTERGRPTKNNIRSLIIKETYSSIIACGPLGFCELVQASHQEEQSKIPLIMESFGGITETKNIKNSKHLEEKNTVVVDLFGDTYAINWSEDESLLTAILKSGLDAPYSCKAGICSTCQCAVLAGEAEMDLDLGLSDEEKAAGLALACQLRPISKALAVKFSPANTDNL